MKYYKAHSKVVKGVSSSEAGLTKNGDILVGKFVDRDRPDYLELMRAQLSDTLGDRYVQAELPVCL